MSDIVKFIPFIIPLVLVEWALIAVALIHLFRHKKVRFGNVWIWAIIIIVLQLIGPILYFTIGKGEEV